MLTLRKLWLLWPVALAACSSLPPEPPPVIECPPPPPATELVDGWQFTTDSNDAGLAQAWYAPDANREDWAELPIGRAWEQTGEPIDGIAWYAREIVWDGPTAYLFLADADDSATVWVDGVMAAELNAGMPSTVLTLDDPDGQALVAVRVNDLGGFGGIKSPPRLAATYESALDDARLITYRESQQPDLPLAPDGSAWTMVGGVDEAAEALIGAAGALSPWAAAPSAEVWLRNSITRETINPFAAADFSLLDHSPIIQMASDPVNGVTGGATAFYDETDHALRWRVTADRAAEAGFDELVIAFRPYRVNRTTAPYCNPATTDRAHIWLNNAPYLFAHTAADHFEADETHAELIYALEPGQTVFDFSLPVAAGRDFPPAADLDERLTEARAAWAARAEQASISVPDETVQAALDASLGYLLLAGDPDGPHPGPLAHDAVWTRDAAYMGLALLMRGHNEPARNYVNAIFDGQEPDGRVPPIQGDAIPWANDEWDAQGQAIYLGMQVYRYTGDEAFLREVYPHLALAADHIITLRGETADDPPATRGLLPPSLSAEDLGDGEQHYYWDDFWALVGLTLAADAADVLGEDGGRWRNEAAELRESIAGSLEVVVGDDVPYIPAAVETLDNSGMARGATPTLHPFPVYAADDPLIRRAFDHYAGRWIAPNDGGYLHREGQFWPYGGIELANAYLRLNRGDVVHQILGWTLAHQTLPGAFAWAEQVDPAGYAFSGGDMPHAWMAASLTILIRNMLVLEHALGPDDDGLTLFQTAPAWWFTGDRQVIVRDLPTPYGALGLETGGNLRDEDGRWVGELRLSLDGASPPGGYRWQLPFVPASLNSDNSATLDGDTLIIPGPGEVTLIFE